MKKHKVLPAQELADSAKNAYIELADTVVDFSKGKVKSLQVIIFYTDAVNTLYDKVVEDKIKDGAILALLAKQKCYTFIKNSIEKGLIVSNVPFAISLLTVKLQIPYARL